MCRENHRHIKGVSRALQRGECRGEAGWFAHIGTMQGCEHVPARDERPTNTRTHLVEGSEGSCRGGESCNEVRHEIANYFVPIDSALALERCDCSVACTEAERGDRIDGNTVSLFGH
jgi:hypothetical protein